MMMLMLMLLQQPQQTLKYGVNENTPYCCQQRLVSCWLNTATINFIELYPFSFFFWLVGKRETSIQIPPIWTNHPLESICMAVVVAVAVVFYFFASLLNTGISTHLQHSTTQQTYSRDIQPGGTFDVPFYAKFSIYTYKHTFSHIKPAVTQSVAYVCTYPCMFWFCNCVRVLCMFIIWLLPYILVVLLLFCCFFFVVVS